MSVPVRAPAQGRRSRGRRIAVIVWLALLAIVVATTVAQVVRYESQPEDQRVPAAGGTVTITEPGEYSIYAESGSQYGDWGSVSSVTAPSGARVALANPSFRENYTNNGVAGVRIATFEASEPGTYTVVGAPQGTAPGDQLVIGTRTIGAVLSMVFGAAATGLLLVIGLIGGLVLLLTRRRRERATPSGQWGPGGVDARYGVPPAGLGPQPGWTPQQGGPAPWPSQQYPAPQRGGPVPGQRVTAPEQPPAPQQSTPQPAPESQRTAGDDATVEYRRAESGEPGHG